MNELDIVIPLFKSRSNIVLLVERLEEWRKTVDFSFQVIFVVDGCPEKSFDQIQETIKSVQFEAQILNLAKNYGQQTATAIGFSACTAPYIATIDDDLQHDPFQLNILFETLKEEQADLVYGVYIKKKHSFFRNTGSQLLKRLLYSKEKDYSMVTSFRMMKASTCSKFKSVNSPILFVDEHLMESAHRISTCLVDHANRNNGKSSYSSWKLFKLATEILLFHSSFPLKLIIRFGFTTSFFFFIVGCYFIWEKLVNNVQLGFTSIIVAIFFSAGMILLSLGIIGEYIRKIWVAQNQLNQVKVSERCKN